MGKGSNVTSSQSSSSTSADPRVAGSYLDLIQQAQNVASTPYQAYSGELVAPVNAQQNLGIGNINANAGFASPYIQQAAGMVGNAANPLTAEQISTYQNPHTQQVVDATMAQFENSNAQQRAQLKGNSISSGALGGNRVGVAQANLAGQQQAAQAPVIAGLYNTGYQQALQTAQQQFQQNPMNAAYSLGNLGIQGQNAALSGAQAQIGAGSLQQQTQQAQNQAAYQQFMQQQAYPFQTAQWLSGMTSGLGPLLGSSTSGTSSQEGPKPNQWNQIAGLGLTAAGMFLSDRRAKESVHKIGKTNDGQAIYRYRYKGHPEWHIGLIAQEVEQDHPDAVHSGLGGMKFVDLKRATDDSAERPHHARGGEVSGFGAMPYADAPSWVPKMEISSRTLQPSPLPQSGSQQQGSSGPGFDKLVNQAMDVGDKFRDRFSGPVDISAPGVAGFSPSSVGSVFAASPALAGPMGLYAEGGRVSHFATGGTPREWDNINGDPSWAAPDWGPGYAVAGVGPELSFEDRAQPMRAAIASGDVDPRGSNYTDFAPTQAMADAASGRIPMPQPRPVMPGEEPDEDGEAGATAVASQGVLRRVPTEAAQASGFSPPVADTDFSAQARPRGEPEEKGLFGLPRLSNAAQAGLMTAGLGMLASRSPFLGTGIGEGGLAGLSAYQNVKSAEAKAENEARKSAIDARKLGMEAEKIRADLALRTRAQAETERNNQDNQIPQGWERDPKTGKLVYEPGGPADPDYISRAAAARKPAAAASMDDETADLLADRVLAGDVRALVGLGRGAQGAENIAKIQGLVAKKAREGAPVSDAARGILQNAASHAGHLTASRRQATIAANLSVYGRTAMRATDLAEAASDAVPRTEWQPVNKLLNAYRTNTGDPKIVALGAAVNSLMNEYARAISGGRPTVHDKQHAEEMLNRAQSPEQFRAVINMMRQELVSEEKALPEAKQHVDSMYNPSSRSREHSITEGRIAPGASVLAPVNPADRERGKVYMTPKGPATWMGNGWQVNP